MKLEDDIERLFRKFCAEISAVGDRSGAFDAENALFYRPAERAGEVWAVNRARASAWLANSAETRKCELIGPSPNMKGRCSMPFAILARTVLELGANPKVLNDRLDDAMRNAEAVGNVRGAETLGFLIGALFRGPEQGPKPTLRLV